MNRKYIELYVISGLVVLTILILLVGKYYFGWFKPNSNNYVRYLPSKEYRKELPVTESTQQEIVFLTKDLSADMNQTIQTKKDTPVAVPAKKVILPKTPLPIQNQVKAIGKTSGTPQSTISGIETKDGIKFVWNEQNFHSLGEYVSTEEKEYRSQLVRQLTINTIVIDKLSKGNGISQEFYKVAFLNDMIPAKILRDIVESKEFRDLIPQTMLNREGDTPNDLKNGETVTFHALAIKKLLLLWSDGRLTPIQKAWMVGAENRTAKK